MAFRIEFFVNDIEKSIFFYQNLLKLELSQQGEKSVSFISNESFLLLTSIEVLDDNHYFKKHNFAKMGGGVEFIIITDQVEEIYKNIKQKNPNSIESDLKLQTWGMLDFRVIDPDGYYIRVSSKRK
ncbi:MULTISPECIES: VOC family protein [Bacillaceae]|uniref:VOC family protein n=1 Tax=Bacillus mesophilum TaxID=1071718 RepID=A0A7V7RKG1_9BACI|nr:MULTISPECIES: VOC family protein [Bacillaceae]KAB2331733.1 VOC family protein [Bacillus mesophilum]